MGFAFRNAWREIRNNRPFCIFYIVNLTLGLIGFISVDSFKQTLDQKVEAESKELLGADLAIRARREITTEELAAVRNVLPSNSKEIEAVDFFSMAAGPTGSSRLVKIIAFDQGFPFYGKIETNLRGPITGEEKNLIHERPFVWIYPELRGQLNIDLGEELKIGETKFIVSDLIKEDTGLSFQPAELAPKVFISKKFLEKTKLLTTGNTAFRNHLFKLPLDADLEKITNSITAALLSPEVRVYSHQRVGNRAGRLLRYLSDFLGLVSLVALFLATLGIGYLYQGFVNNRIKDVAILVCLGAKKANALRTYLIQLSILGIAAAIPAIVICLISIPLLSQALSGFIPIELDASLHLPSIPLAFGVAIFGGWFLALPSLHKIRQLHPAELFQESANPSPLSSKSSLLFALPGVFAFWGLCLLQSDSSKLANIFFLSLLGSIIVLYCIGHCSLWLLDRFFRKSSLNIRLAARSLTRNKNSTITGFLTLGLGVLLLNLIPQFQYSLEQEIGSNTAESKLPKLFLFDIQEDQLEELKQTLQNSKKPLQNITPWIRGKLIEVKGEKYENFVKQDRDFQNPGEQRRNNFRNRSFNLSYRNHLLSSEEILRGRMVAMHYDENSSRPAEISIEQKYAESLDLDLGDQIKIEVSGVEIMAEVVNVRRVKWTSFQPNFFVQMQPGVLENAPKTFIGTLHDLDQDEKNAVQDLLVQKFPTISILDVERTGRKILEIVSQMTWALQIMALLSILAGVVVLYSLAREKARRQKRDINLLKILGASFNDLRMQVRIEFGLLGLSASVLGVTFSSFVSFIFAEYIFDKVWAFQLSLPIGIIVGVVTLSILTAEWATKKVLMEKPLSILQGN